MNSNQRKWYVIPRDAVLFTTICIYILYMMWFQYAFFEIGGILTVLGCMTLMLSIFERQSIASYSLMYPLLGFGLYLILISLFNNYSMSYAITIIKYLVPVFGIYTYARKSQIHFDRIARLIFLSGILLAISLIRNGHLTAEGALKLNNMNTNLTSNFLSLALTMGLLLIDINRKIKVNTLEILGCMVLCYGQIICASRRGFIITLFLVVAYVFILLGTVYKRKHSIKILVAIGIICILAYVFINYESLFQSFSIFQRLSGINTTGDLGRMRYQKTAVDLFLDNFIIGKGLGAVEQVAGYYSHSFYLELLGCTGIIGFIIIIGLMFSLLSKLNYIRKQAKYDNSMDRVFYTSYMIAFVLSILVSGIAMVYIYESYFYIMLAMVMSYLSINNDSNQN